MDRFWNKVDKSGDCWLWTAGKDTAGYGQFRFQGKNDKAHRVSFYLEHGYFPTVTRHTCDNPPCVNPAHLLDGTYKENSDDKFLHGRGHNILTNAQVAEIRTRDMTITILEELSEEFNTTKSTIYNALTGVTFSHLPGEVVVPRQKSLSTKLSIEQIREIKRELQEPWWGQVNYLANKYGVDHSEISHIKSGYAHKNVSI